MFYQKTLNESIELEGIGLHSGTKVRMVIHPAPINTGVMFVVDGQMIKADHLNVFETTLATSLQKDKSTVRTVEHLLAALAGLMVDNAYVELDGSEVPIVDGSAWPFVKAIKGTGLKKQGALRRYLKMVKPVTVHEGDKSVSLLPSPITRITYRIDFAHPLISDQRFSFDLDQESFEREVSPARTFGFLKDGEKLRKAGLARGASLDNAVVIDETRILNDGGLRFPEEFVRHKVLDAIGDLALLGMPFIGHLVADKSGHKLNHRLVREVLAQEDCWILLEGGGYSTEDAAVGLTMTEAVP